MDTERVTLRHPMTGGTWSCPVAAADAWRKNGWEDVPAVAKPVKTREPEPIPAPESKPVKAATAAPRKEK